MLLKARAIMLRWTSKISKPILDIPAKPAKDILNCPWKIAQNRSYLSPKNYEESFSSTSEKPWSTTSEQPLWGISKQRQNILIIFCVICETGRGGPYPQKAGYCSNSSRNASSPTKSSRNSFLNPIQAYYESDYQSRNRLQMNKIEGELVHPYLPSQAEVKWYIYMCMFLRSISSCWSISV